ncbi:hypothetical protein VQ042_08475 [Aurantimonas sp. A2-1-M11]|uniref:hypothetical protein n=1 Tax=Aurantimonas sp. A2-1-M11 TaxID=3113712 RepID=UPI002F94F1AD
MGFVAVACRFRECAIHDSASNRREANLRYVRDMLAQLKLVSNVQNNSLLGYLLEMARLEAEHQISLSTTRSEK